MNVVRMTENNEEPPSRSADASQKEAISEARDISNTSTNNNGSSNSNANDAEKTGLLTWIKTGFKSKSDTSLRDALEEYIEESAYDGEEENSNSAHEKTLIANVLKLRDLSVVEAMIPRADIIAIDSAIKSDELLSQFSEVQYSRIPVYKEKLDDVLGTIHIKDILATLAQGKKLELKKLIRDVPIISPSMNILDLMMQMRQTRKHMAMVVDEYGGIDGLVTMGDIIEEIIGHIEDEHDTDIQPQILHMKDGSMIADARYDVDEFESEYGKILSEEEREENDTLGGLAFYLAGRVPVRGEVLTHSSGMSFEILEADPRRVTRIKISNIPEDSTVNQS